MRKGAQNPRGGAAPVYMSGQQIAASFSVIILPQDSLVSVLLSLGLSCVLHALIGCCRKEALRQPHTSCFLLCPATIQRQSPPPLLPPPLCNQELFL